MAETLGEASVFHGKRRPFPSSLPSSSKLPSFLVPILCVCVRHSVFSGIPSTSLWFASVSRCRGPH